MNQDNKQTGNSTDGAEKANSKEKWEAKKLQREKEAIARKSKSNIHGAIKKAFWVFVVLGSVGGLVWFISIGTSTPESDIVAKNGIHYHPNIKITIDGENIDIPENIGISGVHNPIHTHDPDGFLHLEFNGIVKREEIRLGEFFKVWGKEFSSECILESCNSVDKEVKMFVNGKESFEFENYEMKDGDRIEIKYEEKAI